MTQGSDRGQPDGNRRVRELAIDSIPQAVVVVHNSGVVAMANAAARRIFGLSGADMGRPLEDLEISHRPADLQSAVEKVAKEQRSLVLEVEWTGGDQAIDCFDIHVVPITDRAGATLGVSVIYVDVSLSRRLRDELEHSNRDLEVACGELKSTIEELETAIEDLRSTNEQLETMNAELHSTKEKLQTINDELRMRTGELDAANDFLESVLISQRGGLVVIDRDMRVSVWNDQSAELWGLRPDEAPGRHFLNLDIGLPVEELRHPIKAILTGDLERDRIEIDAANRRGRDFRCEVLLTPLVNRDRQIQGVILLMDEITG